MTGKLDIVGDGGSGSSEDTISGTTTADCGGIKAGTTIVSKSVTETIREILFPFVKPSVSFKTTTNLYQLKDNTVSVVFYYTLTWNSGTITKAELYKSGSIVKTFTGDDITSGISYKYTYVLDDTATFVLHVYYLDENGEEQKIITNAVTFTFRRPVYGFILPTGTNLSNDLYNVVDDNGGKETVEIDGTNYYVADFSAYPYSSRQNEYTPTSASGSVNASSLYNAALSDEYVAGASSGTLTDIVLNDSNAINMSFINVAVPFDNEYVIYNIGYINDPISRLATDNKYNPCTINFKGQI